MQCVPQLSIIIPTRNEENSIEATIQQYVPFLEKYALEIIISDANSTDRTPEILRTLSEEYPHHIQFVQAIGKQNIAIGRNFGAKFAKSPLLFHTDADVRLPMPAEHFFETIFSKFQNEAVVAATTPIRIYPNEETLTDRFYHWLMNTTVHVSTIFKGGLAKGECQIVRAGVFHQVGGYNENLVAGEDCNLFYKLQKMGKVLFINDLKVLHSPRRFRQYGYWKVSYQYLMEGIWRFLLGRSFAREWKVVR